MGAGKLSHAFAVNQNRVPLIFNVNSHVSETGDGGQAVCSLEKIVNFCSSLGNGAEHNASVGDGFVSGNHNLSPQTVYL